MKTAFIALSGAAAITVAATMTAPAVSASLVPAPKIDEARSPRIATAVLAGGCFWGMEGLFEQVKGVRSVVSGYAGGTVSSANYDAVSSERTRHAEAIRISYDPSQVSFGTLLRIYFSVAHDPTQLNRQGPDTGRSYRSAIFPQSAAQSRISREYMQQLTASRAFSRPIATRLETGTFFPAESYHQDFMRRNPSHPYIVRWDVAKVAALRKTFPTLVR